MSFFFFFFDQLTEHINYYTVTQQEFELIDIGLLPNRSIVMTVINA